LYCFKMTAANVLSLVIPILLILVFARELAQAGKSEFAVRSNRILVILVVPFAVIFVVMVGFFAASILFGISG
jgi:hypothetical protein